jgi:hypothetical protein
MSWQDDAVVSAAPAAGWAGDPVVGEPPKLGLLDRIKESVTGTLRTTKETETLPDWATMPELNSFSMASAKTGLGTLLSNPGETVKIITANFPGVQTRQDDKGNFLLRSSIDGKEYAIKPGFAVSDIPRAAGAVAAFTPAGRATTLLGAGAAAAGTQAVIEGTQLATGGDFNPGDVARAGGLGVAIPGAARVIGAAAAPLKAALAKTPVGRAIGMKSAEVPPVEAAAPQAAPESPAMLPGDPLAERRVMAAMVARAELGEPDAIRYVAEHGAPAYMRAPVAPPEAAVAPAAPAELAAPMAAPAATPALATAEELARTARTAALSGLGSKSATNRLAAQAAPDAETLAAADRLGIKEFLQPDHYTTNQAFRQLAQLVKSQTGSQAAAAQREGLLKVAEQADELVTKMGGTSDLSALNQNVREHMLSTVERLKAGATAEFDKVAAAIPPKTPAAADELLTLIRARAQNLGGVENLSTTEKTLLAKLTPKKDGSLPTYALVDDVRKGLNAVKYGKGEQAFQGADDKLLTNLIGALRSDQSRAATAAGQGGAWELAQGLSSQYKGMQDDMASLFGANLDQSLARAGQGGLPGSVRVLAQGNSDRLASLIRAVPPELRQQVTASGLASFFQKTTRGGEMDFAGYAKWFDGLQRNKQAYAIVMSNLPRHAAQQLRDLAQVSRGVAAAKGDFIATGKALNPKALEAAETLTGRIFDEVRRRGVAGAVAEGVGTVHGAPGLASALQSAVSANKPTVMQAADKLITSPEFVEAVTKAGTQQALPAARSLAHSRDFNRFMRALGQPREMRDRERWILQVLQAQNQNQPTLH